MTQMWAKNRKKKLADMRREHSFGHCADVIFTGDRLG